MNKNNDELLNKLKSHTISEIIYVCYCIKLGIDIEGKKAKYKKNDKDWADEFIKAFDQKYKFQIK